MNEQLVYAHRGPVGMDHDRYDWSPFPARRPVEWPGGAPLALFVVVALEWFRFAHDRKPFAPLGAPAKEYPDYREWSWRDYGNRVGAFRVMDVLGRLGIPATAAVNGELARRYPSLVEAARGRGWEIAAQGLSASDLHHAGLAEEDERRLVAETFEALGGPTRGWFSPSQSESPRTPDIVAEHGVDWLGDWPNDDVPYPFRAGGRTLYALPASFELSDVNVTISLHQTAQSYAEQIVAAGELLAGEGGRVLCVQLHPWCVGQPHRIGHLERALEHLRARCWAATGSELLDAWLAQQD